MLELTLDCLTHTNFIYLARINYIFKHIHCAIIEVSKFFRYKLNGMLLKLASFRI